MVSWSRELIPHDFLALAMSETSLQLTRKLVSQACHEEVGVMIIVPQQRVSSITWVSQYQNVKPFCISQAG